MDRTAIADFLRRHRERLRPGDVGLPEIGGDRRRTPGLRREEVASLARISANYYERLEQARGPRPSPQVLAALGQALRLGPEERRYLARIAGQTPTASGVPDDEVPDGIRRLVERLTGVAAYVVNVKYDILAWNRLAARLITDFGAIPPRQRNMLRLSFDRTGASASPVTCGAPDGEQGFIRHAVAELRQAGVRYPGDPEIPELIGWLSARDPAFQEGWESHELRPEPTLGKRFAHPRFGDITLDGQTLHVPERDQRIVVYSAEPGSAAEKALLRLDEEGDDAV